ncbi:MAG: amino acid adenylation domain-containing protein [Vallitalea sp.]|jgi:amino acid adenylation domain-containing protein|nr:amino acid adenylation domain-containing protein [Vallitalea sp.]
MNVSVLEYLRNSVLKAPNKVAFSDSNRNITFNDLNVGAKKIATRLIEINNGKKNIPIAIYLGKNVESILSFMGVVYSGNFYTPIDIKSPIERVKKIFSTLKPDVIITDQQNINKLKQLNLDIDIILVEDCSSVTINDKKISSIQSTMLDTDPLYVLFTSGSTGTPKGVIISHRSVIDYVEWVTKALNITELDILGNQSSFYFDNSLSDIYCTLKNASTTVIIPKELFLFPRKLLKYVNKNKINTIFWVPSALITVANSGALQDVKLSLERVLFCGEVMPNKQLNIWRKKNPNTLFVNFYGPTEITYACSYFIVDREFDDSDSLPIGYPCGNTEILVINQKNELVGEDEIGELCVRGSSLSLGYYNDANKTNESFVQNPLNKSYYEKIYKTGDLVKYNKYGELVYLCRKDFQIKHMGHRIELGEIENVCFSIIGMKQCCALYDEQNKKIILFCMVEEQNEKQIYEQLTKLIPKYMLPSIIIIMDNLPMNANGKIDRVYLKNKYIKSNKVTFHALCMKQKK